MNIMDTTIKYLKNSFTVVYCFCCIELIIVADIYDMPFV